MDEWEQGQERHKDTGGGSGDFFTIGAIVGGEDLVDVDIEVEQKSKSSKSSAT